MTVRRLPIILAVPAIGLLLLPEPGHATAQSGEVYLKVFAAPLHQGRISPMLYGGFVEPLDDHVPGNIVTLPAHSIAAVDCGRK
jgi:hypothetical protein